MLFRIALSLRFAFCVSAFCVSAFCVLIAICVSAFCVSCVLRFGVCVSRFVRFNSAPVIVDYDYTASWTTKVHQAVKYLKNLLYG